jgi:hypothetical protein
MPSLEGEDLARVSSVVSSAFTIKSLGIFLKTKFNLDLESIVGDGTKSEKVFDLLDYFEREGTIREFLVPRTWTQGVPTWQRVAAGWPQLPGKRVPRPAGDRARIALPGVATRRSNWAKIGPMINGFWAGAGSDLASVTPRESAASVFRQLHLERDQIRAERLVSYLDRFAKKRPPCVFILGGPAAGKTTLRDGLAEWLVREGIPAARTGIEEAQRVCFPPPGSPTSDRDYEYTSHGSLVLMDRERPIALAYNRLGGVVRDLRNQERRAVLIEFTHPQLQWAFEELGTDLLRRATVFYLHAPVEVRLARNQKRLGSPSHVPDVVITAFEGAMNEELGGFLQDHGAAVQWIDATVEAGDVLFQARRLIVEKGLYWEASAVEGEGSTAFG